MELRKHGDNGDIKEAMSRTVVRYREYPPCPALREWVRAFFSFSSPGKEDWPTRAVTREVVFHAGDSFCSPLFADSHASIVFSFPRVCAADGIWRVCDEAPRADVIGPMTRVGQASLEERPEMLGVFLRAAAATRFARVSASELADRIVSLEDLWGHTARSLAADLSGINQERARIEQLETALLESMTHSRAPATSLDIRGLAALVDRHRGQISVESLADMAGTSRQHLTRIFRETVGVTPKMYCRLARFHATLACPLGPSSGAGRQPAAGCQPAWSCHQDRSVRSIPVASRPAWAYLAAQMGYADQSHMIAEFRQFSSLTPEMLAGGQWFHPFLGRAAIQSSGGS